MYKPVYVLTSIFGESSSKSKVFILLPVYILPSGSSVQTSYKSFSTLLCFCTTLLLFYMCVCACVWCWLNVCAHAVGCWFSKRQMKFISNIFISRCILSVTEIPFISSHLITSFNISRTNISHSKYTFRVPNNMCHCLENYVALIVLFHLNF